jgi:voltage-gated sodium channel
MATNMYGATSNPEVREMFGTLPDSALTLFQLMTMDGWSELLDAVTEDGHPFAWVFFIVFIFIGSFAILNLFIALVVEALTNEQKAALDEIQERDDSIEDTLEQVEEDLEEAETARGEMMKLLKEMRSEIQSLKALLAERDR